MESSTAEAPAGTSARVIERLNALIGAIEASGDPLIPYFSINNGAGGIALLRLLQFATSRDHAALVSARVWLARARAGEREGLHPVLKTGLLIPPESVMHGRTGITILEYVVATLLGDLASADAALNELRVGLAQPLNSYDLFLGRAGVRVALAVACTFLRDRGYDVSGAEEIGASLQPLIEKLAQVWDFPDLGLGHGAGGVALALLLGECNDESSRLAHRWLGEILHANQAALTRLSPSDDERRSWGAASICNGFAGQAILFYIASKHDPVYEKSADAFAYLAAQCLGHVSNSLCCGYAGQALALHIGAAVRGRASWNRRAQQLFDIAAECMEPTQTSHHFYYSLGHGMVGLAIADQVRQLIDLAVSVPHAE